MSLGTKIPSKQTSHASGVSSHQGGEILAFRPTSAAVKGNVAPDTAGKLDGQSNTPGRVMAFVPAGDRHFYELLDFGGGRVVLWKSSPETNDWPEELSDGLGDLGPRWVPDFGLGILERQKEEKCSVSLFIDAKSLYATLLSKRPSLYYKLLAANYADRALPSGNQ